jgi:SAM-dependent methyltransferase
MEYNMSVQIVSKRNKCRLCDNKSVVKVMPINPSPIADAYVTRDNIDIIQELIPLDLYQCQKCGHVQNLDVVNPEYLFKDYTFHTSNSESLISHFNLYADNVLKKINLEKKSLVVEIGSNDGTLLNFFKEHGFSILGVDPAVDIARKANKDGVPTINNFFSSELAENIKHKSGSAQLIVANNVYAHADNLDDITKGVELLLSDNGVFIFEVSYLLDIIDHFLFDTVYHEHLSIHSVYSLIPFLNEFGLNLVDARHIDNIQGGSIVGIAKKIDDVQLSESVEKIVKNEKKSGILTIDGMREFNTKLHQKMELFKGKINSVILNNRVIGFGASRSAPLIIDILGLKDKIEYVIDNSPQKIGKYLPIGNIPIININDHDKFKENYVYVILGWAQTKRIVSKIKLIGNPCYIVTIFPNYEIIEIK